MDDKFLKMVIYDMYAGPEIGKRHAYGERYYFDFVFAPRSLENISIVEKVVDYIKRKKRWKKKE